MNSQLRKFVLTAHVVSTVGWMGAIAAFLALAATGLTSHEQTLVGSAYLAMKLIGWKVIVPLGLASLLTGLVQSLGTSWGLFRHYWVVVKLVLTVIATVLLFLHMGLTNSLADAAAGAVLSGVAHLHAQRIDITADAAAAVLLLIVTTAISIYKPRGLTPYGIFKQRAQVGAMSEGGDEIQLHASGKTPIWVKAFGITTLALLVLFRVVLIHVAGGGAHHFH